jgi:NAD(P)-dependent dehydrogenase (short-subunit alcohol dehydrogenase family)
MFGRPYPGVAGWSIVNERWCCVSGSQSHRPAVFVTGGSSGIGAAIASEFAASGYIVGCASRRGTVPFDVEHVVPISMDVVDDQAVRREFKSFAELYGLVGLVNAAGAHQAAPSADLDLGALRDAIELNLVSAVRLAQLARPYLEAGGGGFIANIGSFYASRGVPRSLAYSAAKAALASVTRTLAVEWARMGISVVNFAPGYVETELNSSALADSAVRERVTRRIPVRRVGTAHEVGRLVARMLDTRCQFLTGETIAIDGGQGVRE